MFWVDGTVGQYLPQQPQAQRAAANRNDGRAAIRFASPEDTLLHKLVWYKLGDEVSDRQWGDAVGVLKVQAGTLDESYLNEWAGRLGVTDLLERARRDAAGG